MAVSIPGVGPMRRRLRLSRRHVVALRPPPLIRVLALVCVLMCAAMAAQLLLCVQALHGLLPSIRYEESSAAEISVPPLPAPDLLCNDQQFAACLAAQPDQEVRLLAARGRALDERGEYTRALTAFARARQRALAGLEPSDSLAEAQTLVHAQRSGEALQRLLSMDLGTFNAVDHAAAIALMGRCQLEEDAALRWPACVPKPGQDGQSPAEGQNHAGVLGASP